MKHDGKLIDKEQNDYFSILFEVKITHCTAAEIIRQLDLYRSALDIFRDSPKYTFAVVDFDMIAEDQAALADKDIKLVRLTKDFDAWLTARAAEKATPITI